MNIYIYIFTILFCLNYYKTKADYLENIYETKVSSEQEIRNLKFYNNKFYFAGLKNNTIYLNSYDNIRHNTQKKKLKINIKDENIQFYNSINDFVIVDKDKYFLIGNSLLYYKSSKLNKIIKLPNTFKHIFKLNNNLFICDSYNRAVTENKYKFYGILLDLNNHTIKDSIFFDFKNLIFSHFNSYKLFDTYNNDIYAVDPLTFLISKYNINLNKYEIFQISNFNIKFDNFKVLDSILNQNGVNSKKSIDAVVSLGLEKIERITNLYVINDSTITLITSHKNLKGQYVSNIYNLKFKDLNYVVTKQTSDTLDFNNNYDIVNSDLFLNINNGIIQNGKLYKLIASPNYKYLKAFNNKKIIELVNHYQEYQLYNQENYQIYEIKLP